MIDPSLAYLVFLSLLSVLLSAVAITDLARRYAAHKMLIDHPNERSSHSLPTPRGGGLGIAIPFFCMVAGLGWLNMLAEELVWVLLGGGGMVALIGWLDDHKHVAVGYRILVHLLAACWAVFWLGDVATLRLGELAISLHWAGTVLTVVAIVWLINLYNFMDGIDGLAGTEAASAAVAGGILLWLSGLPGLALVACALAAASSGFLIRNWPPAKIFMGDVGSGLLGFIFAVLALAGTTSGNFPVLIWLVLLGIFIMDASYTLLARIWRGEPWLQAHRTHAYQRLIQMGMSHRRVTLYALAINVVLLWPIAVLVWWMPNLSTPLLLGILTGGGLLWVGIQRKFAAIVR